MRTDPRQTPVRRRPWACTLILALALGLPACGGGGGGGGSSGDTGASAGTAARKNAADLAALTDAAGVEWGAYADLLLLFSADGTKPLFDPSVDVAGGDEGGSRFLALCEMANALEAERPGVEAALASLEAKLGTAAARRGGRAEARALAGLMQAGWDFFKAGFNFNIRKRKLVVGLAGRLGEAERESIYKVAKGMWPGDPDLGTTPEAFFANLQNGTIDRHCGFLHKTLIDETDPNEDTSEYARLARENGARSIDLVYEEGRKLLEKGVNLYVEAGSTIAGGALGDSFQQGFDAAKTTVEKVQEAEQAAADPVTFVKKAAVAKVKDRVKAFFPRNDALRELVGDPVTDAAVDAAAGSLAEGVNRFTQAVTANARRAAGDSAAAVVQGIADEDWDWGSLVPALPDADDLAGVVGTWPDADAATDRVFLFLDDLAHGEPLPVPAGEMDLVVLGDGAADEAAGARDGVTVEEDAGTVVLVDVAEPGDAAPVLDGMVLEATPAAPGIGDEVTVAGVVPATFIPPLSLTAAGGESAILVYNENLDANTFGAEFSAAAAGDYPLTFTVTDAFGQTVSGTVTVTVADEAVEPPPVASATYYGTAEFADLDGLYWELEVTAGFSAAGEVLGSVGGRVTADTEVCAVVGDFTGTWSAGSFVTQGSAGIWCDGTQVDSFGFVYGGQIQGLTDETLTGTITSGGEEITRFTGTRVP